MYYTGGSGKKLDSVISCEYDGWSYCFVMLIGTGDTDTACEKREMMRHFPVYTHYHCAFLDPNLRLHCSDNQPYSCFDTQILSGHTVLNPTSRKKPVD